ncbi:MAG: EamA family transporter [Desulfovibrio sp.]|nr:EamA family transporter [Desulfovibrio sp.]
MFAYLWPMALVICANVLYNVASKSVPGDSDPFAVLLVTYLTAGGLSLLGFYLFGAHREGLALALQKTNWTAVALGVSMVALEVGFIYIYRAGWKVSAGSLVANTGLAVALVIVGFAFYKEHISLQQILGMLLATAGVAVLIADR